MATVQADNIVRQSATECLLHHRLQLRRHLLSLAEQVNEELRHVLLLPSVERLTNENTVLLCLTNEMSVFAINQPITTHLLVHGVGLAEGQRIVGFPL